MKTVSEKNCRKTQNTLMFNNFFFEILAFYEIMWKNTE